MKTCTLLLSGLLGLQCSLYAQNSKYPSRYNQRETVILNRENDGNTTIEINNNGVYLNGEQIATRAELNNRNLSKKIVVRDEIKGGNRSYEEYYNQGLENRSEARRALLGVFTDPGKFDDGAYVERVSPNSAASEAGLRPGDVVLRVDSVNIYNAEDLTRIIRRHEPNDRVTITYNRNGKERQTTAVLGASRAQLYEYPEEMNLMPPPPPTIPLEGIFNENKPHLGVSVESAENGVRIRTVRNGSVAESAGLRAGDVITYINDRKVDSVEDVQEQVTNARAGSRIKIEVDRNGKRITRTAMFPKTDDSKDL